MNPNDVVLVQVVNARLTDSQFRDNVRELHAESAPLLSMVQALGLEADMTARLTEIVGGLSPAVVAEIRQATLEMLDGTTYAMPIDCNVTETQLEAGVPVAVDVVDELGAQTIRVRAT